MPSARPLLRPLTAAAAIAGALLLVTAPAASAHDALVSTSPASGAALTSAPTTIALTFEEPPTTQGMAMSLTSPDATVTRLAATLSGDVVSAPVPGTLAPGAYRVAWRVVADDGHPVTGTFSFTLAGSASSSSTPATSTASAAASTVAVATDGAASSSALPWLPGGLVVVLAAGGVALVVRRRGA
jgi:copper resistance protein C